MKNSWKYPLYNRVDKLLKAKWFRNCRNLWRFSLLWDSWVYLVQVLWNMAPCHLIQAWREWSLWKYWFSELFWLYRFRPEQSMSLCIYEFMVHFSMDQLLVLVSFAILFSRNQCKLFGLGCFEVFLSSNHRPKLSQILFCSAVFLFHFLSVNLLKIIVSQLFFSRKW